MSVPSTTGRNEFNFNGSLTSFTFDFPIIETSDLLVIVCLIATGVETPLTEGTDYEVTSALGDFSSGGIVSMIEYIDEVKTPKAWPATYKLILLRDVPATQGVDFTENMATLYENFERGLDKLTMLVQQLLEAQDRTLTVPRSEASTLSRELPPAVDRKNMLLGFDANGKPCVALQTGEQGPNGTDAAEIVTVAWDGNDMKFTKDDATTFSLEGAKTDLKGDTGDKGDSGPPAGSVIFWPGDDIPDGYLECDGASLTRTEYPELYAVLGTKYGGYATDTFNILAEVDDCNVDTVGHTFSNDTHYFGDASSLYGGEPKYDAYFRFSNVALPKGAIIHSAFIEGTNYGPTDGELKATIKANDVDDSTPPTNYNEFIALGLTSASVAWDSTEEIADKQKFDTPDIGALIKSIVDREGWVSGNHIAIVVKDNGSLEGGRRYPGWYNNETYPACVLIVNWVDPEDDFFNIPDYSSWTSPETPKYIIKC